MHHSLNILLSSIRSSRLIISPEESSAWDTLRRTTQWSKSAIQSGTKHRPNSRLLRMHFRSSLPGTSIANHQSIAHTGECGGIWCVSIFEWWLDGKKWIHREKTSILVGHGTSHATCSEVCTCFAYISTINLAYLNVVYWLSIVVIGEKTQPSSAAHTTWLHIKVILEKKILMRA
jgi:hypothetical protein